MMRRSRSKQRSISHAAQPLRCSSAIRTIRISTLNIDGRGRYCVAHCVNNEFSVLSDWKTSPAINAAGS